MISTGPESRQGSRPGALVLSLDFELHWGVRDHRTADGPYREDLVGARTAVPEMLARFRAGGVECTWATVGMLMPRSRAEREALLPAIRARYQDPRLDPYQEPVGEDERSDPLHYAPSLVAGILATPGQELATHTWSHYYCREPGADAASFAADLDSARRAAALHSATLRSIVFPRNQHEPAFDPILLAAGLTCYRGTASGWMNQATTAAELSFPARAARLLDLHLGAPASRTFGWDGLRLPSGLVNVPASFFLRPVGARRGFAGRARLARIMAAMIHAARHGRIVHLWWHPHNFGRHRTANLALLDEILATFDALKRAEGMISRSMGGIAAMVAGGSDG